MRSSFHHVGIVCGVLALLLAPYHMAHAQSRATRSPVVQALDQQGLHELLKSRKGRALVLNVWATWCLPCIEEFPRLIRLDSLYRSRGLDVVTVSIDFEDEVDSKVRPLLRRMHSTMPAYVNAFPTPADLINDLATDWSGAIPATFFYDREGALKTYVVGQRSFNEFQQLAETLLGPPAGSPQGR